MVEICYNAKEAGMIDDPRTSYNNPVRGCKLYKPRHKFPKQPKVCGNCKWYSVQDGKEEPK